MFADAFVLFGVLSDLDELTWSSVNTVKSIERLFAKFLLLKLFFQTSKTEEWSGNYKFNSA